MSDSRVDLRQRIASGPRTSPLRKRLGETVVLPSYQAPVRQKEGRLIARLRRMKRDFSALTWALRDDIPAPFSIRTGAHYEPGPEYRTVRVVKADRRDQDSIALTLEPIDSKPFEFCAGQFVTVLVEREGETLRRAYSLCGDPADSSQLHLAIRRVPGGLVSGYLVDEVNVGETLRIQGPAGQFGLTEDRTVPERVLLVGAGSGVTPLLAIAYTTLQQSDTSHLVFLIGNRCESRAMLVENIAQLAAKFPKRMTVLQTLSQPKTSWQGLKGRIGPEQLKQAIESFPASSAPAVAFMCGPTAMMDATKAALIDFGFESEQIHSETFTPPAQPSSEQAIHTEPQAMNIIAGERTFQAMVQPGETILDAALRAGAPMPYSCSVGGCGACKVNLKSGEVSLPKPNCLSDSEIASGATLTCVGCAQGPITIEIPQ